MKRKLLLVLAATFTPVLPAAGQGKPKVMTSSDCFVCHRVDQPLVGPSFLDISRKYKQVTQASKVLADRILKGGSGNWGAVPMTPHADLEAAAVEQMVAWILALGKGEKDNARPGRDAPGYQKMFKADCFGCHMVDQPLIGPSFEAIAKKYQGQTQAVQALVTKIKEGGSTDWGDIPMAAHGDLEDPEAMVEWILKQAPQEEEKPAREEAEKK